MDSHSARFQHHDSSLILFLNNWIDRRRSDDVSFFVEHFVSGHKSSCFLREDTILKITLLVVNKKMRHTHHCFSNVFQGQETFSIDFSFKVIPHVRGEQDFARDDFFVANRTVSFNADAVFNERKLLSCWVVERFSVFDKILANRINLRFLQILQIFEAHPEIKTKNIMTNDAKGTSKERQRNVKGTSKERQRNVKGTTCS
jgi:hypothetical protein